MIFDCFGVLIEDALAVMREKLKESAPEKYDEVIEILHASHRGLVTPAEADKKVAKLLGLSEEEFHRQLNVGEMKNQPLLDYILQLKGKYKTVVLSNISKGTLQTKFTSAELAQYFDVVVTSGDEGYAKPEAQIYEIAADRLSALLSECVFTDDNEDFCEAARGLGMQAILYKNFAQFKSELEKLLAA